jgi:hypothetical protein
MKNNPLSGLARIRGAHQINDGLGFGWRVLVDANSAKQIAAQ